MDLTERLVLGALRLAASVVTLVGSCMLVAAVAVAAGAAEVGLAAVFLRATLTVAISSFAAGIAARYLARWKMTREEPHWVRWRLPLALTLVGLSTVMVIRIAPVAAFWREAFVLMRNANVWGGLKDGATLSAIALAPVAAALVVPAIACAAAAAFVAGTIASLVLLAQRNVNLPRVYLASFLLQAALVVSIVNGAALTRQAGDAIEREIQATHMVQRIRRYEEAVAASASTLMWTLGAHAVVLLALYGPRIPARSANSESVL